MRTPRATYRVQLGPHLGFGELRRYIDYFDGLGISHLYLSPIWKARKASTHGYDVVDPTEIDPRLGTRAELRSLARDLEERGMGIICDFVPNHMAASHENPWWWDVLGRGRASRWSRLFDIDWKRGGGKVVLPVLGAPLEEVIASGELTIQGRRRARSLVYHDRRFPLRGEVGDEVTQELLDAQAYRLMHWRSGEKEINYRRFFDINDLVAIRTYDDRSFRATHRLLVELARKGIVSGVRIDHVDGLRDPAGYLQRLTDALPDGTYVVVEKILARGEDLPGDWACHGTTGYEFSDHLEAALVDERGLEQLRAMTERLTGAPQSFAAMAADAKRQVIREVFRAQLDTLVDRLVKIAPHLGRPAVEEALVEITVALDVYRTYVGAERPRGQDKEEIETAIALAREHIADPRAADHLACILLMRPGTAADEEMHEIVSRWQQLSAAAMAKGVEDTALYRYVPLVSRNEVGAEHDAIEPGALHDFLVRRQKRSPASMNASSTHDSKRGEDVRARIDVLAGMPGDWETKVRAWMERNAVHKTDGAPDATDELLLYQTLVGSWPMETEKDHPGRIKAYMLKAAREAKRRTDWRSPNARYEKALDRFVTKVLASEIAEDIAAFARNVAQQGARNSIARLAVKATAPGVPDFYQGTELWHTRLVDPDNRAPVDLDRMHALLEDIRVKDPVGLLESWPDGKVKLAVTARLLGLRRRREELFAAGRYVPLEVHPFGRGIAFARRRARHWAITCIPRGRPSPDLHVQLPLGAPTSWREVLTDRNMPAADAKLPIGELLSTFPAAVLEPHVASADPSTSVGP